MTSEHQRQMGRAEQAGWPQRIKDTCDMCSASKVKCDTKKPICSRCKRLEYPCFYSPARRVRKHRLDENSRAPPAEQRQQHQEARPTNVAADESASHNYTFSQDSNGPNSLPVHNLFSSAFSMSEPSIPYRHTTNRHYTSTKRLKLTPPTSPKECQQSPIPENPKYDCAATAIDLLQNLDPTSLKPYSSSTSPNGIGPTTLDFVIKEASVAIRRTSVILICPCSRNPDIGLLAAGVCSALLDVYQTFFPPNAGSFDSDHHGPASSANLRNNGQCSAASCFNARIHDGPINMSNGGGTVHYGGLHAKAPIMRILGELPRIADLVMQFRNRYSQDEDEADPGSRELLRALVASMTSRLKTMIDEFTNLLVEN